MKIYTCYLLIFVLESSEGGKKKKQPKKWITCEEV